MKNLSLKAAKVSRKFNFMKAIQCDLCCNIKLRLCLEISQRQSISTATVSRGLDQ